MMSEFIDDRNQNILFGLELQIDRTLAYAGMPGDIIDSGLLKAVTPEKLPGSIDKKPAAVYWDFFPGHSKL